MTNLERFEEIEIESKKIDTLRKIERDTTKSKEDLKTLISINREIFTEIVDAKKKFSRLSQGVLLLLAVILILILSTAQANLGTFKEGKLIFPDTNKPYTGNLDVINNNWGVDAVEFNKDYVDGVLHGTEKSYYQSGKLKSLGYFKKGILDGIVTGYYEDSSIQVRAIYDNGVKQGRVIHYYPNGNKQLEAFYTDDKFDGVRSTWYENGKPMETMPYSKGLAHGTGRTYYETGGVFEEAKFEYGEPKIMRVFTEDGKLSEQKGWIDKKIIERIVE